MIYDVNDNRISDLIDSFKTGNYGEDSYRECSSCVGRCFNCGCDIYDGDKYYDIDDRLYCNSCEDYAKEEILSIHESDYIR